MIGRGDERWVELAKKVLRFTVDAGRAEEEEEADWERVEI